MQGLSTGAIKQEVRRDECVCSRSRWRWCEVRAPAEADGRPEHQFESLTGFLSISKLRKRIRATGGEINITGRRRSLF